MYLRGDGESELASLQRVAAAARVLEPEEEQRLARAAKRGDARAFDRLVRSHVRLVFAMAAEHRRYGAPMRDLVAEGLLGLVIAARRFDPDRGARLAVYAAHWIRASLRRYTLASRRIVGPPSTRTGRFLTAHLARAERELSKTRGEVPDSDALAQYLGVSTREIEEVKAALQTRDAAVNSGTAREPGSVELVSDDPSPEALVEHAEEQRRMEGVLTSALSSLATRERDILRSRYLQSVPPSLTELGDRFGISGERVRQIEARGYAKLREAVRQAVA